MLKVEYNGLVENWLEVKKSMVKDGGFGVFALHDFSPNEFGTAYLKEKIEHTYFYKDKVSLPMIWKTNGFLEEYCLGHRVNHRRGWTKYFGVEGKHGDSRFQRNQDWRRIMLGL
jgi:hypothetical protein